MPKLSKGWELIAKEMKPRAEEEAEQPRANSSFRDVTRRASVPETLNPPKRVKDREVTLERKVERARR
ncbi:hypothetical protein SUGI_1019530 [Cryptomeria japonica]|nr:hypothetical protein SUGI_1019530 [Cryptomeria japonica]